MYILLTDKNTVAETIPDENPIFPGVPIDERYAPDFVNRLIHLPDDTEVAQNWEYDPDTGNFAPPAQPEPAELPDGEAESTPESDVI